jgi:hypothetical protein
MVEALMKNLSRSSFVVLFSFLFCLLLFVTTSAQPAKSPAVKTIEIKSPAAEAEVGTPLKFTAVAKDEGGVTVDEKPSSWVGEPWDLGPAA